MAGPVLNLKIFTKSTPHTLRALSIVTFPPGFLFLFITGIASHKVNPAIGILPLFLSATFGILLLANEKQCGCQHAGLTGTPIHLVVDLLLGLSLLVCLILTWVFLPHGGDRGSIMLGTYASNFLIVNFLIHFFFTAQQLHEAVLPGASDPTSCPRCQFGPFTAGVNMVRHGYAPLLDGEGEPNREQEGRQSAEDAV